MRVAVATNTNSAFRISRAGFGVFLSLYSPRKQCNLSPFPVRLSTDPKSMRVGGTFRHSSSFNSRLAAFRVDSSRLTEPLGMLHVLPLYTSKTWMLVFLARYSKTPAVF